MRDISTDLQAALSARAGEARNFIWLTGVSFADGTTQSIGFWNGIGTITASVVDGETLATNSRDFIGTGTLLQIDDIPLTSDVSIRTINATLSQIDSNVADAVRGFDLKNGPVQIYRGTFNPSTGALVEAAACRFVGFISKSVITTPSENQDGSIVLTLASHTQELARASSEKRSSESQKRRAAGDTFYDDTAVCPNWPMFWGVESGKKPVVQTGSKIHNAIFGSHSK